ncbi:glycosyl transferase, partial [Francisella tularensis subsp. holarctica]|nr:glycosyl transferase [Francisella tularensis subsp. holarctica]
NGYGEVFELSQGNKEILEKIMKVLETTVVMKKRMREYIINNISIEAILEKHEKLYYEGSV